MIYRLLLSLFITCGLAQAADQGQLAFLFVHGINDSSKQGIPFEQLGNVHSLDFDCTKATGVFPFGSWPFNMLYYCSLGQGKELEHIHHELQSLEERFPHAEGFVLIGASRGSSAIINYVAEYKPNKVKALILESPFDLIENIARARAAARGVDAYLPDWMIQAIVPCIFSQFRHEGVQPAKVINDITEDIPMLFVTVRNDSSVPVDSTMNLIVQRQEAQYKNIHHLHLLQGKHGALLAGPEAEDYKRVIHAFFAEYNLPHNAELAAEGKVLLPGTRVCIE